CGAEGGARGGAGGRGVPPPGGKTGVFLFFFLGFSGEGGDGVFFWLGPPPAPKGVFWPKPSRGAAVGGEMRPSTRGARDIPRGVGRRAATANACTTRHPSGLGGVSRAGIHPRRHGASDPSSERQDTAESQLQRQEKAPHP